ncbi:hypothetical protein STEG23_016202 [Scotinomys teguina]
MENFLRLLREHGDTHSPPQELVTLAGKLCRDFQHNLVQVFSLVEAILDSQHCWHLLENADVALVCTQVLIQQEQPFSALQILEGCRVPGGNKELVQLWNDIHYHLTMRKLGVTVLSPVQKFRCRKRNPPPLTLCPEGPKNRNFLPEIRCHLQNFATGVNTYPKKAQLKELALETGLSPEQVYNWFANYRRRQKACVLHTERDQEATSEISSANKSGPEVLQLSEHHHRSATMPQWSARCEGSGTLQSPEATQELPGLQSLAVNFPGDNTTSQSLTFSSNMLDSSMAAPESRMMPLALSSSKEVFLYMGQLDHKNQLDSGMDHEDATMAMAFATLSNSNHAGFTDLHSSCSKSLTEDSPGLSSEQAASTAGSRIHHPHRKLVVICKMLHYAISMPHYDIPMFQYYNKVNHCNITVLHYDPKMINVLFSYCNVAYNATMLNFENNFA